MSNNDLRCSKCGTHHHPIECPKEAKIKSIEEVLTIEEQKFRSSINYGLAKLQEKALIKEGYVHNTRVDKSELDVEKVKKVLCKACGDCIDLPEDCTMIDKQSKSICEAYKKGKLRWMKS